MAQLLANLTSIHEDVGLDTVLLWLWRRLAAVALIRHLAWEPPYSVGVALKKKPKKKKRKKKVVLIETNRPLGLIGTVSPQ